MGWASVGMYISCAFADSRTGALVTSNDDFNEALARSVALHQSWTELNAWLLFLLCVWVSHYDVMTWKCCRHYWPSVTAFHQSPVDFPLQRASHAECWCFLCCRLFTKWLSYRWVNTPQRSCDVTVMQEFLWYQLLASWKISVIPVWEPNRLVPCELYWSSSQTCKRHPMSIYRQTSNINSSLVGNKLDHSDVVGASPVGAAPTTSSFST